MYAIFFFQYNQLYLTELGPESHLWSRSYLCSYSVQYNIVIYCELIICYFQNDLNISKNCSLELICSQTLKEMWFSFCLQLVAAIFVKVSFH